MYALTNINMFLLVTKVPHVLNKYTIEQNMSLKPLESIQKKLQVGWNRQQAT